MRSRAMRFAASGVAAALVMATPAVAAPSLKRRARVAVRYIISQQQEDGSIRAFSDIGSTSDAILAMVVARRGPGAIDKAIGFLRDNIELADTTGEKAKVVLALVAAGRNPRSFADHNLVAAINSAQQPDGQYGTDQTGVFSHALAILGLEAAGAHVPREAMKWLAQAQCSDGGWQYDEPAGLSDSSNCIDPSNPNDFAGSDSNTTSYAVQAWNARPSTVPLKADPFDFFKLARDEIKDGWVYDPTYKCNPEAPMPFCSVTDANSTALVLQAYAAEDKDAPSGSLRALRRLQYRLCGDNAGAFAYSWVDGDGDGTFEKKDGPNLGATIAAVPGLLRRPLPIAYSKVTERAPKPGPC